MTTRRVQAGFTLIELVIVVAIIAILAGIAYPGYLYQLNQTRQADAQTALVEAAARMQEFYIDQPTPTYVGAALGPAGIYTNRSPAVGPIVYYNLAITNQTATNFSLTATPNPGTPTANNVTYILNANGSRQHVPNGQTAAINGWP